MVASNGGHASRSYLYTLPPELFTMIIQAIPQPNHHDALMNLAASHSSLQPIAEQELFHHVHIRNQTAMSLLLNSLQVERLAKYASRTEFMTIGNKLTDEPIDTESVRRLTEKCLNVKEINLIHTLCGENDGLRGKGIHPSDLGEFFTTIIASI
jgi:hypothetical protein